MTFPSVTWSIAYRHLASIHFASFDLVGTSNDMIARMTDLASDYGRTLEVEDYTDQIDFFFRDAKNRRRRFATLMCEG